MFPVYVWKDSGSTHLAGDFEQNTSCDVDAAVDQSQVKVVVCFDTEKVCAVC